MTHASLFSGIGGFDLAAEWAGWTNAFNCEIDPFCRKVLKYHFPDAEQYEDIRTADFTIWRDHIDVLSGGFPCQPFSLAGKRKWFGHSGREKLQGAGSVKRDSRIWEDWCREQGLQYRMIAPGCNRTKLTEAQFKFVTQWHGRSSVHGRDAAMLFFGR